MLRLLVPDRWSEVLDILDLRDSGPSDVETNPLELEFGATISSECMAVFSVEVLNTSGLVMAADNKSWPVKSKNQH
jgi:hypothetical protein